MRVIPLAIAVVSSVCHAGAWADEIPSFQPLGILPGYVGSAAGDVTTDGSVVVGLSWSSSTREAFRWTPTDGMVGLGDIPGDPVWSSGKAVSADGSVIVGYGAHASGRHHAFRWTQAEGMVDLGDFPGGIDNSGAYDVSGDGRVVVGVGTPGYGSEAFRWTAEEAMVGLGYVPGYVTSWAGGISSDSTTIVGSGDDGYGSREAFRWTAEDGMVGLGDLPGGTWPLESRAVGVSADGGVIVGRGESSHGYEAMRWTAEDGMIALGDLPGGDFDSNAVDVAADGSLIVGRGTTDLGREAFIWDAQQGMRNLQDVLEHEYALDLSGWRLVSASGISDDGRSIVGKGINPDGHTEAFLARIPEAQTLVLTMVAVLARGALERGRRCKRLRAVILDLPGADNLGFNDTHRAEHLGSPSGETSSEANKLHHRRNRGSDHQHIGR